MIYKFDMCTPSFPRASDLGYFHQKNHNKNQHLPLFLLSGQFHQNKYIVWQFLHVPSEWNIWYNINSTLIGLQLTKINLISSTNILIFFLNCRESVCNLHLKAKYYFHMNFFPWFLVKMI